MDEYIEREVAVKAFNNFDAGRADNPPFTLLTPEEFAEYLYELPAADVAPVVHGRIVGSLEDGRYRRRFSCCGEDATMITQWAWPKYCPNCGAKMDGGDSDARVGSNDF